MPTNPSTTSAPASTNAQGPIPTSASPNAPGTHTSGLSPANAPGTASASPHTPGTSPIPASTNAQSPTPASPNTPGTSPAPASPNAPHPRIIFMGTPEFAVASLSAILDAGYNVVAVITAPDKPAGRGMQMTESAVKKFAKEKGLHILQPEKLKNPDFLEELKALKADLQIVVAFRMLPESVWDMPPMGTVNLHGSLLPQYRGAAPINWAVINGERTTGVTTFKLKHEIDTGSILLQESFPIAETDTAGDVHDRMKDIGANLLVKTIEGLANDTLQSVSQTESKDLKHAPKIFTETALINWKKTTEEVYNLIRGLSPFPAAFTHLDGKILKIYRAEKEKTAPGKEPGTVQTDQKTYFKIAASDGYIKIIELQLEGKKKMKVEDFLRGYRPPTS